MGAIEKSSILLSQYWKNYHFDGSNNIFADCITIMPSSQFWTYKLKLLDFLKEKTFVYQKVLIAQFLDYI